MSVDENLEQNRAVLIKSIDSLLDSFLDLRTAVKVATTEDEIRSLWDFIKTRFVTNEKETEEKDAPTKPSEQKDSSSPETTEAGT